MNNDEYYKIPAFPGGSGCPNDDYNGMTLRDYFAAKAMQEGYGSILAMSVDMLSRVDEKKRKELEEHFNKMVNDIPVDSYKLADAMIKEREK